MVNPLPRFAMPNESLDLTAGSAGKLDRLLRTWSDGEPMSVLVADRHAAVRQLICAYLDQIGGFQCEQAGTLAEVQQLLSQSPQRFCCAALDLDLDPPMAACRSASPRARALVARPRSVPRGCDRSPACRRRFR